MQIGVNKLDLFFHHCGHFVDWRIHKTDSHLTMPIVENDFGGTRAWDHLLTFESQFHANGIYCVISVFRCFVNNNFD